MHALNLHMNMNKKRQMQLFAFNDICVVVVDDIGLF